MSNTPQVVWDSPHGAEHVHAHYHDLLRRWPVPALQRTVDTAEGPTFVLASGPEDAPPLLLLHGSASTATAWLGDVATWARHFRVYAVDLIGEPGLSAPTRPPLGSDAYARWLDDVLDALGVGATSIVGMSLGGWLAVDYAVRRPARVTRLALLAPGGFGRQRTSFVLAALLLRPFGTWGLRRTLRFALGAPLPTDTPAGQALVDHLLLVHRHFRPRRQRLPRFDAAALGALRAPVLAIVGGRDRLLDSHATRERLTTLVPGATVVLLPDAGHLLRGQTGRILAHLTGDSGS
ncbi:alpha/beta fold hydrolase [Micromonospora carbonacea]|uniref:alpha/beta fold hydrolase n=1 Tax=Micromonospora carbonacea TaxID=47853 RepID=UPI00331955A5